MTGYRDLHGKNLTLIRVNGCSRKEINFIFGTNTDLGLFNKSRNFGRKLFSN